MKYFERKISVEDKMNLAVSFIIEGRFDIEKLRDSLDLIVKNNDIFRYTVESGESTIKYILCDYIPPKLDVVDVKDEKEASSIMREITRSHSDEVQFPCWEFHLYRISEEKHIFLGKFPHSCMDGTAIKLFIDQLINLYNGAEVEFPNNYSDYLNSISSEEELAHIREMQEYWDKENEGHKQIVDVTPVKGTACNYEPFFTVDLESVHKAARKFKTSHAMLFLYLCQLAYAVSYGVNDIDVITMVSGRNKKEYTNTLGKFISGSHNRIIFDNDKSVSETFTDNKVKLMKNMQLAQLGYKYPGSDPFMLTYLNNSTLGMLKLGDAMLYPNPDLTLSDDVDAELIMIDATETNNGIIDVASTASYDLFTKPQRKIFVDAFMDAIDILNGADMTFGEFAEKHKYKGE